MGFSCGSDGKESAKQETQAQSLCWGDLYTYVINITDMNLCIAFSSVQFSRSVVSNSLRPHESQHARPPCPSPSPEFTQTHVHRVRDAIQPSHPRSSPSPPAPNPSQHQSLYIEREEEKEHMMHFSEIKFLTLRLFSHLLSIMHFIDWDDG